MRIPVKKPLVIRKQNFTLRVECSPCSRNRYYPAQFEVELFPSKKAVLGDEQQRRATPTGWVFVRFRGITIRDDIDWPKLTTAEFERGLAEVLSSAVTVCKRCGKPTLQPTEGLKYCAPSNREGLCELCYGDDFKKKTAEISRDMTRKFLRRAAKMFRDGARWYLEAWLHNSEKFGDDVCLEVYFGTKPTTKQVEDYLRKKGSVVLDDYKLVELSEIIALREKEVSVKS